MKNHTDITNPADPLFGSHEWVMRALHQRFVATPEKPAEVLNTLADYLQLRKLHALLWKPAIPSTKFVWIDPDEYDESE